jgi:hypothetical protein
MTLGANRAAHADHDNIFSRELRRHAGSLDLTSCAPVGDWNFGQGIRRAAEKSFFWELRAQHFLPLGLNHPIDLSVSSDPLALTPQSFSADVIALFPVLKDWTWSILPSDHEWLKKTWVDATAWKKAYGENLREDATFKAATGWLGFSVLERLKSWAIPMGEFTWVASNQSLPAGGLASEKMIRTLKILLSLDVLAPTGRLAELAQLIQSTFPQASLEGLNLQVKHAHPTFSARGLAHDSPQPGVIGLCFPLSFLPEDLVGIEKLLTQG